MRVRIVGPGRLARPNDQRALWRQKDRVPQSGAVKNMHSVMLAKTDVADFRGRISPDFPKRPAGP